MRISMPPSFMVTVFSPSPNSKPFCNIYFVPSSLI
nr:MAG TPA: hypothetical protein [Bacteriophage sp.]